MAVAVTVACGAASMLAGMIVLTGCSDSSDLQGYERIGSIGRPVVYARLDTAHRLSVIVRDGDDELCHAQAVIGLVDTPAICDDSVLTTYVFVGVQVKGAARREVCDTVTGAVVASRVMRTPSTWPVDLVALTRNTSADPGGVVACTLPGSE